MHMKRMAVAVALAASVIGGGMAMAAPANALADSCYPYAELSDGSPHCYGPGYFTVNMSNVSYASDGQWYGNWSYVSGGVLRNECVTSSCPPNHYRNYSGVFVYQLAVDH